MKITRPLPRMFPALLAIGMAGLLSGNASALTLGNLKDSHLDDIYGTYGPGGDCKAP